ncbi:uncharacterized protein DS421_13g421380 [Arachis hypogaea]|nr:uncharacterized protein DS421_13g421380 [Arachis hypogaea]
MPCHGTANRLEASPLPMASSYPLRARHSHSIIESYSEYHRQGLDFPDSLECRHHSSLRHEDSEAICGVERQFLCQFGRSTLVLDPFLALDARFGQKAGVKRQFTSSILGQRRSESNNISSPSSTSESDFCSIMKQLDSGAGREKLMEVQNMGLGWLQYVPEWAVNQDMMIALASSYSRDEKSLVIGTRKILISVESIARCFGLPNHGNSFKSPEIAAEHRLVNSFTGKTQADLKRDIITCSMQSDVDRINFRRQFIMLIAKCFFFPSPKATISDIYIRAAIDVSNPRKMYWARYIYDFLIEEVLRFQDVGKKTVDGCMFALLIIYLHANKHGDLGRYNGRDRGSETGRLLI